MANRLYDKYRASLGSWSTASLSAVVDLAVDTIKLAAVSSAYAPNSATDQFWSAASAAVIGTPQVLAFGSATAGVYKSSNSPTLSIPASTTVTYLVIYKDTGNAATSPLIAILDTVTGLPLSTGASTTALTITMDVVNGWFKP